MVLACEYVLCYNDLTVSVSILPIQFLYSGFLALNVLCRFGSQNH